MPLITIESNIQCQTTTLSTLSYEVAQLLGKPESYVMVRFQHNGNMLFAGSAEPLAFVQLKSLGLPDTQTREYSSKLCALVNKELGIDPSRIYIEFISPERHMWGWDSATF